MSVKLINVSASIPSGSYSSPQEVHLRADVHDAAIYYTTDGSEPSLFSTRYGSPINISKSTTIKYCSNDEYGNTSLASFTQTYIIEN